MIRSDQVDRNPESPRATADFSDRLIQLERALPLEMHSLLIGNRVWEIMAAIDQDRLLDFARDSDDVPYGFLLWESAVALARYLVANSEEIRGKRVLELGAGVGLVGLVARSLGAEVWQSDHQPDVLILAQANAQRNGITGVHQFVADWRAWSHDVRYDLILGADILYEREMHPHLTSIFEQNLVPGGRVLLSDPGRQVGLEFAGLLENTGWRPEMTTQPVNLETGDNQGKAVEVMVLASVHNAGSPTGLAEQPS